jgi:hypothetical protein
MQPVKRPVDQIIGGEQPASNAGSSMAFGLLSVEGKQSEIILEVAFSEI